MVITTLENYFPIQEFKFQLNKPFQIWLVTVVSAEHIDLLRENSL